MIRIKNIRSDIILFFGESEKWHANKNDILYISVSGLATLLYGRKQISLRDTFLLISCRHSNLALKNTTQENLTIKSLLFSVEKELAFSNICYEFNHIPLEKLIYNGHKINNDDLNQIIIVLKSLQNKTQESIVQSNNKKIDLRLIKINRYIRNNFHRCITLSELAQQINVHPTYLSNTYSRVFNKSPIYHLNQIRINEAKKLLESQDLKVRIIAETVGYSSLSQFSSIFKRFCSLSPSEYRNQNKIDEILNNEG